MSGEPAPSVRWGRNTGTVDDPVKYNSRYDKRAQEHILEVRNWCLNKDFTSIWKRNEMLR